MADTTEKAIADELREAATKARKTARLATRGPWKRAADSENARDAYGPNWVANWDGDYLDSVGDVGEGLQADRDAAWICLANPLLAEPLASWLESAEWVVREHPQDPNYAGLPDFKFCTTCNDEETTCVAFIDHALAVARVLNGTSREVQRG